MPSPKPYNPWHGLLHAVTERLVPLFQIPGQTTEYARRAAREAIAAYRAESRADYVCIGRILALSFATIAASGQSTDPNLPPALQLRFLTNANSLSRSAEQAERGMIERRHQRSQRPDVEDYLLAPPDLAASVPEPTPPEPTVAEARAAETSPPTTTPAAPPVKPPALQTAAIPAPQTALIPAPQTASINDAILTKIDAVIAGSRALLAKHPAACLQASAPPPSFRQTLRNHVPIDLLRPTG